MIVPSTFAVALLCALLSMVCWGSWANTLKAAGKWRFELYYFDYTFGVALVAVAAAFTLGSAGDGLSVTDNLLITGKMKELIAVISGGVFNLANLLLVAAITLAGMSVAFPVAIGLALVIGVVWSYVLNPQSNPALLFGGVALVLAAILASARAHALHSKEMKQGPGGKKGIVLSLVSGVLMGSFYPLVEMSKQGDDGLGPYAVALLFALGVFLSTFVYSVYFMRLPMQGRSLKPHHYFRGTLGQHLLGLAGGAIWCIGAIASFAAASAPKEIQLGPAASYALGQGATLVSVLWGLLVWKEFAGAAVNVRRIMWVMFGLFAAGLTLVSIAPLYS